MVEERISVAFDKATMNLEHREFMLDGDVQPDENDDAVTFAHLWVKKVS